jgi:integrase
MRVITVKVKGLRLVNGIYRSRKVLPPDIAAILGKKELTKSTGVAGQKGDMVALAKAHEVAIREDHAGEFQRIIKEARETNSDPLVKLEREIGDLRRFKLEEIADFLAERGYPNPFIAEPEPKEPVNFGTLLDTWELENSNKRTLRTKRRYMGQFAAYLQHSDALRVSPPDFIGFKEMLLRDAKDGKIAYKSVENTLAGVKAVFNAGLKAKKIEINPIAGIGFQAKKSQMGKTLGYTVEQVGLILREGRNQPPHFRYPTLIAAFSGARIGEIADATTYDIYRVAEMWVLDIRADYREAGQEIKNEPSIRIFPLHHQIVAEGFIDYWKSQPPGPLFPAFSVGQDNRRGDAASREISEWVRRLGIKDPSPKLRYKPNHSFRNYVKTKWRSARVEKETHDAITGHGSSKDDSRNYGEYELRLMLDSIERLPNPLAEATTDLTEAAE